MIVSIRWSEMKWTDCRAETMAAVDSLATRISQVALASSSVAGGETRPLPLSSPAPTASSPVRLLHLPLKRSNMQIREQSCS